MLPRLAARLRAARAVTLAGAVRAALDLAAVSAAAFGVACSDRTPDPLTAPSARLAGRASVAPAPAASVVVPVEVPATMRSAPFDVARSLTVPAGYGVRVYARVPGARFMAVAPNGDLLVSIPGAGKVVLVRPGANGADPWVSDWATGLYKPHDIVFHTLGGQLYVYVAEGDKIARYRYTDGDATGQGRQVVVWGLPNASSPELGGVYGHELKNIALDGGKLYVSIASTCNACASDTRSDPVRGAIYEYDAGGGAGRLYARGLRNAEGLAFVPGTSTLWVVVNNRDNIAYPLRGDFDGDGRDDYGRVMQAYVDNHPPELFTRVRDGGNYGWPFCNADADGPGGVDDMPLLRDVELNADGSQLDCATADRASKGIQAHSAPLGLTFLQGTNAPAAYRTGALVALHGSWNRATKTGYKVVHFAWDAAAGLPGTETDFVTGWATASSQWGRPVDVAVAADGGIYVSDDYSGTIYRVAATATADLLRSAVAPGVCGAVAYESTRPGMNIVTWTCDATLAARRYLLTATGMITTNDGASCMDVMPPKAQGADVVIWSCAPSEATQRWTRTAAGELTNVQGLCLTIAYEDARLGRRLVLWPCNGGPAQRWTVATGG